MASVFPVGLGKAAREGNFTRAISNHLAGALLLFSMLQIVIVAVTGGSVILHLGVIVLIAAVIPSARNMERRWERLSGSGLSHAGLLTRFRVDVLKLWTAALLLPLVWYPASLLV